MVHYKQQQPLATTSDFGDKSSSLGFANDLDDYNLTVGEASSLMVKERCKFASNRKVQRMCRDGVIDCYKLQTTRNGQPVSEWLVNETSLLGQIEENEIKWDEGQYIVPDASGDAKLEDGNASQTPEPSGNAKHADFKGEYVSTAPDAEEISNEPGNADPGTQIFEIVETKGDAVATPESNGGANEKAFGDTPQKVGETRNLASVLIENAKLTAQLEGAHNLIEEVQGERKFLREELKDAREGRKDVAAIAERMLETLETIAIGGKLMPGSRGDSETKDTQFPQREVFQAKQRAKDTSMDLSLSPETQEYKSFPNSHQSGAPYSGKTAAPIRPFDDQRNPFRI